LIPHIRTVLLPLLFFFLPNHPSFFFLRILSFSAARVVDWEPKKNHNTKKSLFSTASLLRPIRSAPEEKARDP
jgi:hypothetical protein